MRGVAAAVRPVAAQSVIKTDIAGLMAGEVGITVKGQAVPAYRPQRKENQPIDGTAQIRN